MLKKMNFQSKNKVLIFSFLLFIIITVLYNWLNKNHEGPLVEKIYPDTFIPKGHVLVPIELANIETVAALINQFGVIDLYSGSNQTNEANRIASKIKILRAPLNPHVFAVLVDEQTSTLIMKKNGPFWAVVQNSKSEIEVKKTVKAQKISIEYYKGG